MPQLHWTQRPENKDRVRAMATKANKVRNSKHWMQKPENKAKAIKIAATARKAKAAKPNKTQPLSDNRLIERQKELMMQVNYRLNEIETEIRELQAEKKQLMEAFDLQPVTTEN